MNKATRSAVKKYGAKKRVLAYLMPLQQLYDHIRREKRNKLFDKYKNLDIAHIRALKNSYVKYQDLDPEWLETYRVGAVDYRQAFLKNALESLAQIEGVRKANDNIIFDYGLPYAMDFAESLDIFKKILALKNLRDVIGDNFSKEIKDNILKALSDNLFSLTIKAESAYSITPKNSPFKSGNGALLNSNKPIATRSFGDREKETPPENEYKFVNRPFGDVPSGNIGL